MDAMLRALADGTRRQILTLVWSEERSASAIAAEFDMTRPAVSQHLGVLLASDLVSVRRQGTQRFYRANREEIVRLRTELATMWDSGLDRLKQAAETTHRKGKRQ